MAFKWISITISLLLRWQQQTHIMKCMHNFFHYDPSVVIGLNRKTLRRIVMARHSWSLLIFCAMHLRGEEKLWSCSLSKSTWTLDHKVRSMCAKLSSRQVCLCAWESQAPLAFWSRARLLYFSLTLGGSLYPCVPVAVRWSGVRGGGREGGVKERGRGEKYGGRGSWLRGGFNQWAWQLLLSSGMPGHCSILCSGKFLSKLQLRWTHWTTIRWQSRPWWCGGGAKRERDGGGGRRATI